MYTACIDRMHAAHNHTMRIYTAQANNSPEGLVNQYNAASWVRRRHSKLSVEA